jgi:hypothetical protein
VKASTVVGAARAPFEGTVTVDGYADLTLRFPFDFDFPNPDFLAPYCKDNPYQNQAF